MRLGGPVYPKEKTPEAWIAALREEGYRAAYCPVGADASDAEISAYASAAREHDIVISEVGAWSNPIAKDDGVRRKAIEHCKKQLALAEKIGARCCVNIAGSRGDKWDGPDADNYSDETFDRIVETTREIIDAVKPERTFFTLETMPWALPDSADAYLKLLRAIDRPGFAVHLDPVNMINSPRRYYRNGDLIREFFAKLGPYIKNCHAKDIRIGDKLTVHLDEAVPGTGGLDYAAFLTEANKLHPDTSFMVEHLSTPEEYRVAAGNIRKMAAELGIPL